MTQLDTVFSKCLKNEADNEKMMNSTIILEKKCQTAPRKEIKIIIGDLNDKLEKEHHRGHVVRRHSLQDVSNDNGNRLVEFAITINISVKSTQFQRKDMHKITWVSINGVTQNQIDHVLIDGRFS